jgi:phage gpG-like protein
MPLPGFSIRMTVDEYTPFAQRLLALTQRPDPMLQAVGEKVVEITRKAFTDPEYRQATWPPLRDGSESTLTKTGALFESIGIIDLGGTSVTVGIRPISRGKGNAAANVYAAVHQFGATITPKSKKVLVFTAPDGTKVFAKKVTIPARPFFPVTDSGEVTPLAKEQIAKVLNDYFNQSAFGA